MAKRIVTFNNLGRYGRLGNQMFQIASTIGIARANGFAYAFPQWRNYDHRERFKSTESIDSQDFFVHRLPVYNGPKLKDFNIPWGYYKIELDRDCSLMGHMQSEKYFEHCADEIRYYFRMNNEYVNDDFCAVHVRLGDYDGNYHPRLGIDYYKKAMKEIPASQFLVFSDEPNLASEMFDGMDDVLVFAGTNYMDEFKRMKSCKHFIIGNSTFSWWAAWLGEHPDKKVVAPSTWFGKVAGLDSSDIYAKNWIVV